MEKVRLGDICNINAGGTPSRTNTKFWDNGDIPWCKISDFKDKYINITEEKITVDGLENSSTKLFKKGTILYTIFATIGEVAILNIDSTTNQAIAGIQILSDNFDVNYIYYYLKSMKKKMIKASRGVAQNNINLSILRNLEIDIININKQKDIVKKLDKVQEIVDIRKKQIEELEELIKAQFVEMFFKTEFPKEKLANNVEEMFIGPFGSALKNECFVEKSNGYCVVYEQKHAIYKNIDDFRWVDKDKYESLKRFNIQSKDIIVSCRGTIGKTYVIPENAPLGIMHPSIMKIRLKKEKYIPEFFEMILQYYLLEKENRTNGATIKMGIRASTLEKEEFIIPDMQLQVKYLNFVQQIDEQKLKLQKSLEETQELQESLMNKYFS